jgi:hypothetical protein
MAPEFRSPFCQLPIIPTRVLKKHRVHEPLDTRFRSAARLLQALWREDRGLGALKSDFNHLDERVTRLEERVNNLHNYMISPAFAAGPIRAPVVALQEIVRQHFNIFNWLRMQKT